MSVDAIDIIDSLETPEHHLFLDHFESLVVVDKVRGTTTVLSLRGQGPHEVAVPLSLVNTTHGPGVSGLFHLLHLRSSAAGFAIGKKTLLPLPGPLVYRDGVRSIYGAAGNYWQQEDGGWQGYSAMSVTGQHTRPLYPFHNPIGGRHPRAFAALAMADGAALFGEPVTLDVHLYRDTQTLNLPLESACLTRYQGQKPKDFSDPMAFVQSWDRFAANGAWLVEAGPGYYAMVALDVMDCPTADTLSVLWTVDATTLQVVDRQISHWRDARPLDLRVVDGQPRILVGHATEAGTDLILR